MLHVRLMHAAVRWMILHDPSVILVDDLAPPAVEGEPLWSRSWGVPTNQEDLLGTWFTFNGRRVRRVRRERRRLRQQNVADHMHLWRLIGHHLGVDPRWSPTTRADAAVLRRRIFTRQQRPCGPGGR